MSFASSWTNHQVKAEVKNVSEPDTERQQENERPLSYDFTK